MLNPPKPTGNHCVYGAHSSVNDYKIVFLGRQRFRLVFCVQLVRTRLLPRRGLLWGKLLSVSYVALCSVVLCLTTLSPLAPFSLSACGKRFFVVCRTGKGVLLPSVPFRAIDDVIRHAVGCRILGRARVFVGRFCCMCALERGSVRAVVEAFLADVGRCRKVCPRGAAVESKSSASYTTSKR